MTTPKTHVHVWFQLYVCYDPKARLGSPLVEVRACGCKKQHARPWRPVPEPS
ncbi:hypothetical protein [Streptomyces sp. CC53]|uniref:hypothetical protein n=1 Tax=Streptomyces sp. CC53 TaxID=1906740 RepID=UPI0015A6C75F|nr:hypothetical protein [Streptomyces sp. CC53]